MTFRSNPRLSALQWAAVALLVIAGVGVGALVAQAYQHTTPPAPSGEAARVPTFTLGVQTPAPTPTPPPAPAFDRTAERFLITGVGTGSNVWWRGVAGSCGGAPPTVERSTDGGATWTNVTPPGVSQLASIERFDQTEADLVVGVGANCEAQALRTFTQGQFWEPNSGVLASARYAALTDPASIASPAGSVSAPCAQASGVRARGELLAVVCDGVGYVSGATGIFSALPAVDAVAIAVTDGEVLVAHTADGCAGLSLTGFAAGAPDQPVTTRCLGGLDASTPLAIAESTEGTLLWAGDTVLLVP